jgi:hypothetical protein
MLLSIHIPKTAGTNFTHILRKCFTKGLYLDYGTERDLAAARTCAPSILNDTIKFEKSHCIIHGHYHYLKYKDIFLSEQVLVTMRHPVNRVISQYRHIALNGDPRVERHRLIMEGKMDVLHFAKFPFIANAQSYYLEGIEIEKVDHIIVAEFFPESVAKFVRAIDRTDLQSEISKITERKINSREGDSWRTKAIPIMDGCEEEIERRCAIDMDLYLRALDKGGYSSV